MPTIPLDDVEDPRLGFYRGVGDPELLRNGGRFIAEGRLVVRRLLASGRFQVESVLVTPAALASLADVLQAASPDLPVFVLEEEPLVKLTGFNLHRGCLALGVRSASCSWRETVPQTPARALLIVLERLANADNVGGAFRNAQAFGVDAVLMDSSTSDPLYRKAIRTSMGASLAVPFARDHAWPSVMSALREEGVTTIALTPRRDATDLDDLGDVLSRTRRIAWLLGNEGAGLSGPALAGADLRARIPIAAAADSLNAGTALAIALYATAVAWRRAGVLRGGATAIS